MSGELSLPSEGRPVIYQPQPWQASLVWPPYNMCRQASNNLTSSKGNSYFLTTVTHVLSKYSEYLQSALLV